MVEITVGNGGSGPAFRFTQETYTANMSENAMPGQDVVTVSATGRNSITYSFVSGNHDDAFTIDRFQGEETLKENSVIL